MADPGPHTAPHRGRCVATGATARMPRPRALTSRRSEIDIQMRSPTARSKVVPRRRPDLTPALTPTLTATLTLTRTVTLTQAWARRPLRRSLCALVVCTGSLLTARASSILSASDLRRAQRPTCRAARGHCASTSRAGSVLTRSSDSPIHRSRHGSEPQPQPKPQPQPQPAPEPE